MHKLSKSLSAAAFIASLGSAAAAQPSAESIPVGPFKTMHMMIVPQGKEAALMAAAKDYNREFAAEGCPTCGYHVFKLGDHQDSKYNYAMIGEWPGRDVYIKLHVAPKVKEITQKNPFMIEVEKTQIYGRYVEMK
jgi:hypothetical protein